MSQIKVELQETMGTDRSIADAAWTSSLDFQSKQLKTDDHVKRVVNMLADLKHSTPFESVIFRFWIKMPIQTDRQHMTHRIASHSGMSGRYRTMPNEWFHAPLDIQQISIKAFGNEENPEKDAKDLIEEYENECMLMNHKYQVTLEYFKEAKQMQLISNDEYKRLREFFRGMLPQNNMTERVTIMNLRSFANYQKLRNSIHAQPEIQEVARQMLEQVKQKNICPIALDALERNGWNI